MKFKILCPNCGSPKYKKNGHTKTGKQNHRCKDCGRQFVLNPQWQPINNETRELIERLLLERLSLLGICRTVGVSIQWLLQFIVQLYKQLPDDLNLDLQVIKKQCDVAFFRLETQADEMWSFVGKKDNKQWIWIALDAQTRQIIAFHVGDRSRDSAKELWRKIPDIYKQHATFYTDKWDAYVGIIPYKQHQIVNKQSGKTSYIERFNCTMRQRISRLVRKALSFSKKLENHIGAIKYFICHYNLALTI
jgi:IS1 family transposase